MVIYRIVENFGGKKNFGELQAKLHLVKKTLVAVAKPSP